METNDVKVTSISFNELAAKSSGYLVRNAAKEMGEIGAFLCGQGG